jgi:hypothetical protein
MSKDQSSERWFGTMDGVDYDMDKEGFVATSGGHA